MCDLEKKVNKAPPNKGRKRVQQPELWKKNILREKRYTPSDLPTSPKCKHNTKSLKCGSLTMTDLIHIHNLFYGQRIKLHQDNFILKYCVSSQVSRRRPTNESRKNKNMTVQYFLPNVSSKTIRVCKAAFISILNVSKDRVTGVLQRSYNSGGSLAKETRGGDHRSKCNRNKRIAINNFIQSFHGKEAHYCRSKSSNRLYLSSDLSIKKMWHLYCEQAPDTLKVKVSFFRKELNTKYNIGFGSPRTDVCSRCTELSELIKTTKDPIEKQSHMVSKRIHSLKAKAFYELLKESSENILTLSFDCQKNHPLPKLPDQSAYFSRQYNFYNFTIVIGTSKSPLTKENVISYYWYETERPKGSNEIASAVFHTLREIVNIPGTVSTIRLFADGCGGQNKNSTLIGMCSKWLYSFSPPHIKKVEIIFPVVGHSFLPSDRVFAKIEKEVRKKEVIVNPQQYVDILSMHGKSYHLTEEVQVLNWKNTCNIVLKPPGNWHFKFNLSKRFFLFKGNTNISVQGEENYKHEKNEKKWITKKGKLVSHIEPVNIAPFSNVKKEKVTDVCKLLEKHYGNKWRELSDLAYYCIAEQAYFNRDQQTPDYNEENDIQCEGMEENEKFV